MSRHKELAALFDNTLKRYRASRGQCGKGFGRMAKAATGQVLRDALRNAREAAGNETHRVDAVFAAASRTPHDHPCEVTDAHFAAAKDMVDALKGGPALDDGLAAAAATLEGYAALRLAVLRAWAGKLGLEQAFPALDSLRNEAQRSRDRFAMLVGREEILPQPDAGAVLTPKQAALLGLR